VGTSVSNKALGIGLGVGIGCLAALGLAGLIVHNRRKQARESLDPNVTTHWGRQSFMGAVAAVVAKLPRTPSQRSHASSNGIAVGHGEGATEIPPLARQY
jgi:hypothetical protein